MQLSGVTRNFDIYALGGKICNLTMDETQTVGDLKEALWRIQQTFHPSQMRFLQNGKDLNNRVSLDSVAPKINLIYRLMPAPEWTTEDENGKTVAHHWRTEIPQKNSPSKFISLRLDLPRKDA